MSIIVLILAIAALHAIFRFLWGGEDRPGKINEPGAGGCLLFILVGVGLLMLLGGK